MVSVMDIISVKEPQIAVRISQYPTDKNVNFYLSVRAM